MRITLVVTFAGADLVTIKVAYSWSPPSSADPCALACRGTARTRLALTWLARTWLARNLAGADLAAARCRDTSGHCLATVCPNLLTQPA